MLIKAQLVSKIAEIIKCKGLTQTQAAALLEMPQPKCVFRRKVTEVSDG